VAPPTTAAGEVQLCAIELLPGPLQWVCPPQLLPGPPPVLDPKPPVSSGLAPPKPPRKSLSLLEGPEDSHVSSCQVSALYSAALLPSSAPGAASVLESQFVLPEACQLSALEAPLPPEDQFVLSEGLPLVDSQLSQLQLCMLEGPVLLEGHDVLPEELLLA